MKSHDVINKGLFLAIVMTVGVWAGMVFGSCQTNPDGSTSFSPERARVEVALLIEDIDTAARVYPGIDLSEFQTVLSEVQIALGIYIEEGDSGSLMIALSLADHLIETRLDDDKYGALSLIVDAILRRVRSDVMMVEGMKETNSFITTIDS